MTAVLLGVVVVLSLLVIGALTALAKAVDQHRASMVVLAATLVNTNREVSELTALLKGPLRVEMDCHAGLEAMPAVGGKH